MTQRTVFLAIILLAVLAASAAVWWIGSADDRRVSACLETGIEDQARLARCAEGSEVQAAVLADLNAEQRAEIRRRVRARLTGIEPTQVDKSRYEHLSIRSLQARGLDPLMVIFERSEVPAAIAGRRIALDRVVLGVDLEGYGFFLTAERPEALDDKLFHVNADIEDLNRKEREFIRTVCANYFLIDMTAGCPVTVYGQIVFRPIFGPNLFAPRFRESSQLSPLFHIEAVEFLNSPI